jgi:hypothetical protein
MPNESGTTGTGVFVELISGIGEEVGGKPPSGVGVVYCPHKDAFPTQEASMEDEITKRIIARFTISIRCRNYTCLIYASRRVCLHLLRHQPQYERSQLFSH